MSIKTKIAVFVSGGGTNLQALIDKGLKNGEIALVISNRESAYALERAEKAGIKALYIPGKDFEKEVIPVLEEEGIELIVLAGFLKILSGNFVSRYEDRIINVHPSLIPSFCGEGYYGLKVHEKALERGVKLTGATVHLVNSIPDGGRILKQKAVEVKDGDTPEILQRRVMEEAEWIILPEAVDEAAERIGNEKDRDK